MSAQPQGRRALDKAPYRPLGLCEDLTNTESARELPGRNALDKARYRSLCLREDVSKKENVFVDIES